MWAQDRVACFWVDNVGLPGVSDRILGHVSSLAEAEIAAIKVGLFVLTRSCTILKCLESLVEFVNADSRHF